MVSISYLISVVLSGVFLGSLYALVGSGLSLIFGVMRIVNLAHGEFLIIGGYTAFFLFELFNLSIWLVFPLTAIILVIFGILSFKFVIQRSVGKPMLTTLIITLGLSFLIRDTASSLWGTTLRSVPIFTEDVNLFLGISFSQSTFLLFFTCILTFLATYLFLNKTDWGRSTRAASESPDLAESCGINVNRVQMIAWTIGVLLAGIAGLFVAINFVLYPQVGFAKFLTKAFAVVIIGGLGSIEGALVGGILLGVIESLGTAYLTSQTASLIAYLAVIVVLVIRPTGLMGKKELI